MVGKPLITSFRAWFAAGEDVNALLPVLQAYLGHCEIGDTACCPRLTAGSCPHIAARVQAGYGGIVPPFTGGPAGGG